MPINIAEVALKALTGGLFVLAFAAVAQLVTPKRFAGVFSAAPSVALGSLIITALYSDVRSIAVAARGMAVGAAAFTVCCLLTLVLVRRMGAWPGSLAALAGWGVTATAGYLVVLR